MVKLLKLPLSRYILLLLHIMSAGVVIGERFLSMSVFDAGTGADSGGISRSGNSINLKLPYRQDDFNCNSVLPAISGVLSDQIATTDTAVRLKLPNDMKLQDIQLHGTTTMAFVHRDSVIVCVDSKASIGSYVGSRTVKKVFPVSKSIVATMAGGAADCAHFIRKVSRTLKLYEHELDMPTSARIFAHLLAKTLKQYQGAGSSDMGLSVGTMVSGWDQQDGPSVWYVDDKASCISGDLFCVGSGQQHAYAIIDEKIQSLINRREAIAAAKTAATATASSANDGASDTIARDEEDGFISVDYRSYRYGTGGLRYRNHRSQRARGAKESAVQDWSSGRNLDALELEEAVEVAIRAVRHATYRDGFSGGFINALQINETGIHHLRRVDSGSIPMQ